MSKYINYKVKDIQLAEWGRREIRLAEAEMPGLMSLRKEFGDKKPLKMLILNILDTSLISFSKK